MNPRIGLIISIFLLFLVTPIFVSAQQKDCRKVDVTVDIIDSKDGKGGKITVASKSREPGAEFMLHIIGKGKGRGSKDDQFSIKSGTIENLLPGDYELVIHFPDANYCSETRKVTVN